MEQEKNNKKIIFFAFIIIVIAAIVGIFVIPNMVKNYEDYLKIGNYEEAYARAKTDEEKENVIIQNSIDFMSRGVFSNAEVLIDQMHLEKAWYDVETNCFLLAYRDIDNSLIYEYFNYNEEKKKYTISAHAINEITIDKIELPEDIVEATRKAEYGELGLRILKSAAVETIEKMMIDENLVKDEIITNINNFVKERNFDDIPLLIIK